MLFRNEVFSRNAVLSRDAIFSRNAVLSRNAILSRNAVFFRSEALSRNAVFLLSQKLFGNSGSIRRGEAVLLVENRGRTGRAEVVETEAVALFADVETPADCGARFDEIGRAHV